MALIATSGPIPKNAVKLNRDEAVDYQWLQIQHWPNQSEVWPFKWGIGGLGLAAAAAGSQISNMYRKKLKLRHHGFLAAKLPMVAMPALFSALFHVQMVSNSLFLRDTDCPLCLQARGALIQASFSTVYPILLGPVVNFMLALHYGTYRVPYYKDVGQNMNLWWKLTKPMSKTLLAMGLVQGLAGSIITYLEGKCFNVIQTKSKIPDEDRNAE